MNDRPRQAEWTWWVIFIFGWAALSLLFAPEAYLFFLFGREPVTWRETLELTLVNAGIAVVFLPLIVWLTRRFPMERKGWAIALLVHVPACLLFSVSHSWLYYMACYASRELSETLFIRFQPNLLTYWAIVGFTQAVDYFQRYTEREKELAQVNLLLLKSELHPHFLFNTLHTISAMMHEDLKAADIMINRLSDMLRMTVDTIGVHEVPLRQEIDFLKKYVEIEQIRFADAFQLRLDIDSATLDALVPTMVLQPLVENSIRHGFDLKNTCGIVSVTSRLRGDRLELDVRDNGRGAPAAGQPFKEGLGITNTRRRLLHLYGDRQVCHVDRNGAATGFRVTLTIPFRPAHVPSPPTQQDFYDADSSPGG